MKTRSIISYAYRNTSWLSLLLALLLMQRALPVKAQATVSTPMGMGSDCGGGNNSYNVFNYNTATQTLTNLNTCSPSLKDPVTKATFSPTSGSTTFDPVTQMLYYIETTSGNNSIIWTWTPGTCPTGKLAPIYTFANDFIVGLEFNTVTGTGYQLEFSTGNSPYTVYLRQITSFSPPVFGTSVPITFPAGTTIYSQNSDYVITPTGVMYLAIDNKIFSMDYSTYSTGVLNAVLLDSVTFNPTNDYIVGLAYADGKLIASITNQKGSCFYQQIDFSSGTPVLTGVTAPPGTASGTIFSSTDMATLITGVGAAKKVSSVTSLGGNEYQVQYDVKIRNFGNLDLVNVQTVDNLQTVFGSALVSASVAAVGTLPTGLAINTSYNGSTNTNLFASGGTMIASPPDSAIVRITAILNNPSLNTVYNNSAIASATGSLFAKNVTDSSDNRSDLNPDPNGNAVPDDPGEGVPTPLLIAAWTTLSNTLIDFNAQPGTSGNNLHWTLQNQTPGLSTLVQRSTDGLNFETLTQIPAGTGSNQAYSWQDTHPPAAVNYYRLQVVVTEGVSSYSDIIAVRSIDQNAILSVNPNPFHQSVNFSLTLDNAGKISYRILDLSSHLVLSGQASGTAGQNIIAINGLGNTTPGIYILEVQSGDNRYIKKLVKIE